MLETEGCATRTLWTLSWDAELNWKVWGEEGRGLCSSQQVFQLRQNHDFSWRQERSTAPETIDFKSAVAPSRTRHRPYN